MKLYQLIHNGEECTFSLGKSYTAKLFKPIYEIDNDIHVEDLLQIFESNLLLKITHFDYSEKYLKDYCLNNDDQTYKINSKAVILPVIKPKITYMSLKEFKAKYENHYLKLIDEI